MTTLIIGGSSQLAFYIIKLTSEQIPSQTIYASFRSQSSYEQQKSQLNSINISGSNLVPLFIEDLDAEFLINFFEKHFLIINNIIRFWDFQVLTNRNDILHILVFYSLNITTRNWLLIFFTKLVYYGELFL